MVVGPIFCDSVRLVLLPCDVTCRVYFILVWGDPICPLYLIPSLTVSSSLSSSLFLPYLPLFHLFFRLSISLFFLSSIFVNQSSGHSPFFIVFLWTIHTIPALEHIPHYSLSLSHRTVPPTPVVEDLSDLAEIASLTKEAIDLLGSSPLAPRPLS